MRPHLRRWQRLQSARGDRARRFHSRSTSASRRLSQSWAKAAVVRPRWRASCWAWRPLRAARCCTRRAVARPRRANLGRVPAQRPGYLSGPVSASTTRFTKSITCSRRRCASSNSLGSRAEEQRMIDQARRAVGLRPEDTLGRYPHQLAAVSVSGRWWRGRLLLRPGVIVADGGLSDDRRLAAGDSPRQFTASSNASSASR